MKGFISIPKSWFGAEGYTLLSDRYLNIDSIVSFEQTDTGTYINMTDGTKYRIYAPFSNLKKKIEEDIK